MTTKDVIQLLEKNKNERGIKNWEKLEVANQWKGYGIGLTQLRKLGKQIGRNHELALELWKMPVYEAKVLGTLIDEPKKISREQAETQIEDTNFWMLSHVFCSCDGTLAKVPYVRELTMDWTEDKTEIRRRAGYLLLYELAKNKKDKALTDAFFEKYLNLIETNLQSEENFVRDAMNNALMRIGMRNENLHKKALAIAQKIGKVKVNYGANLCEAVNVIKHLTSERVLKKFS